MAVDYLIGLGHSDIAFLTAPTGSAAVRADAYRDTMTRHGWQDYIRVIATDLGEHSGFEAMSRLIDSGLPPSTVFDVLVPRLVVRNTTAPPAHT